MKHASLTAAGLALAISLSGGCGDGRPERLPVTGQVLIDGQPLTYGQVLFHSKNHRPAVGEIKSDGHFQLSTYELLDGCVPGTHQVTVDAGENVSVTARKWHAPPKYAEPETSDIVVEVAEDMKPVEITLSWDGGKPYIERIVGGE
jgi:hypothetical protein